MAVLIPTIPGRETMLEEAVASAVAQTRAPDEILVGRDDGKTQACGPVLNRLAGLATAAWLAVLADDDLLLPEHLRTLLRYSRGADVVYSWCDVVGRPGWSPNQDTVPENLMFPATALIRRSLWEKTGGWGCETRCEDHEFWVRCRRQGGRFRVVPTVTWVYRFHGANKSLARPWREGATIP